MTASKRVLTVGALLVVAAAAACRRREPPPDTLVVFAERDVEGVDPHTSGQLWQTQSLLANLYETLVTVDPQMSLVPGLAASWSNPNEVTWEFQLRHDIPFQSGGFVEARDVEFSLLRARDHERSVLRTALADIEEVKPLAKDRVLVRTRLPDATLASRLREVFIVSRRCVEEKGEAALEKQSCGTGPYALAGRSRGAVDLVRFDRYWKGAAAIPKGRFVAVSYTDPGARRFLPKAGGALFQGTPGSSRYDAGVAEAVAHFSPSLSITYLSFDLRGPATPGVRLPDGKPGPNPFLDPRVREAVARSIDTEGVRQAMKDEGFVPSQLVPPVVFGFDPQLPPPRRDAEGAARLLAATPFASGFDVTLDLRPVNAPYGPPIVRSLAPLNIRVETRVAASDKEFFERVRSGQSSLYVLRFSCRAGDAQELFDKWVHSREARRGFGEFNYSYDVDPVPGLDAEIETTRQQLNSSLRLDRLQRIMRRVMEAYLAIPLFNEKDYTFASRNVDFSPRADSFRLLYEMKFH